MGSYPTEKEIVMGVVLVVLLVVLLIGVGGFALHALWFVAAVLLLAWLVGFAVRSGESARWYRW